MSAAAANVRIGPYEIVRMLGQGGMAQVYQARKVIEGVGLVVALKVPRQHIALDPKARERFIKEARITARLGSHANIVQVLDVGVDGELPYMAMEYVTGVDLGQLCQAMIGAGLRWSEPAILWVLASLVQGLKHAWGAEVAGEPLRVVHRDISPQNVLLTHEGYVKLTDFGISRMAGVETSGTVRGKVRYMPAEQLQGRASTASDLFAVGAIGWELLEGKRFRHDRVTPQELHAAAFVGERPEITRTDVSPQLRQLVHDLLDPAVETRIQNPADAWAQLRTIPGLNLVDPDPVRTVLAELFGEHRHSGHTRGEVRIHPELLATRAALAAVADARSRERAASVSASGDETAVAIEIPDRARDRDADAPHRRARTVSVPSDRAAAASVARDDGVPVRRAVVKTVLAASAEEPRAVPVVDETIRLEAPPSIGSGPIATAQPALGSGPVPMGSWTGSDSVPPGHGPFVSQAGSGPITVAPSASGSASGQGGRGSVVLAVVSVVVLLLVGVVALVIKMMG